jgi:GNAT superfamily N-acetyltransferase
VTRADDDGDIALLARSEALQLRRVAAQLAVNGSADPAIADIDAGVLIALGPERFVNRLFATRSHLSSDDVDRVVAFFEASSVPPSVQIANPTEPTVQRLRRAGFGLDWERALCTTRTAPVSDTSPFEFERVDESSFDTWLDVLARGNEITQAESRAISDAFARAAHAANDSVEWLACSGDTPVGCGSLLSVDGVGWLGGAATLPDWRERGVQSALLAHRLDRAAAQGFGIVAATAVAASGSARNLVRCGFDIVAIQHVYTRR